MWNVNCARATAFIFDTRTGVLEKVSKFWDRKCLDLRGTRNPNLRIHAEFSNLLSYQGQTFAVPCYLTSSFIVNDLLYVVNGVFPLHNYTDDNTLAFWYEHFEDKACRRLQYSSWLVWRKSHAGNNFPNFSLFSDIRVLFQTVLLYISEHMLKTISCVKLLGVEFDAAYHLMTTFHQFASVFPIKSMACVV